MASEPSQAENTTEARSDTFVGRVVVERKLTTQGEVDQCMARQRALRESGQDVRLSELLVKSGSITAGQLRRLGDASEDSGARTMQQLPGFHILQRVGSGAMATVYKAKQLSLDRTVAIKVLPKRLSENPEFVKRFYKEGRAAARLNHNNIVQAIDVSEAGGYHYFVMEFVDGVTVSDVLAKNKVYAEKDALDVVIQIAQALEHAHARGFLHRDVKPKNIMITKGGIAKLADMGLAREASDAAAAEAEAGRAYGTPYYISPEQIRGEMDIDFRTDIYSLGATFYHMVTGRVPFDGATPPAVMQKHLKEPLVPPDHINQRLSTGTAELIERMMAKDRNRRYSSTTDLLVDLERVRRGEAPLQARSGVDKGLLANLADGQEHEHVGPDPAATPRETVRGGKAAVIVCLVAAIVIEFIIILTLLLSR